MRNAEDEAKLACGICTTCKRQRVSPVFRFKLCKICRKPCFSTCPHALARYRSLLKSWQKDKQRNSNFVTMSVKYITRVRRWTQKRILERLQMDNFSLSIIASAFLFVVGIKLTSELNAWSLPRIDN